MEVEPDVLQRGCVLHAPAIGQGRAQLEAAPALAVGAAHGGGGALERHLALRIVVRDLDPYAVVAAQAHDVGGGAGVDHGIGHQLAGEHHGVVDDVGMAPPLERVADEGPGARHGPSDGLEAGGRARGDHRTPRPSLPVHGLMADRLAPLLRQSTRRPGIRGLLPRDQSGGHSGRPSDARSSPCHRPDRTDRFGWTAVCKVTYLCRPSGCRSAVFPPRGCADDVRSCRTVMAWFGRGETLGKLLVKVRAGECAPSRVGSSPGSGPARRTGSPGSTGNKRQKPVRRAWAAGHSGIGRPLREGHSGVWRSDAGHEDARERRTVPE
ncbi:hypothetical protein STENM36S_07308 [Streptomyces tendae]